MAKEHPARTRIGNVQRPGLPTVAGLRRCVWVDPC